MAAAIPVWNSSPAAITETKGPFGLVGAVPVPGPCGRVNRPDTGPVDAAAGARSGCFQEK